MYTPPGDQPASAVVLVVGVLTFFGWIGVGHLVVGRRVGEPWSAPVGAVTGVLVAAAAVELAAMVGGLGRAAFAAGWAVLAGAGAVEIARTVRRVDWPAVGRWLTTIPGVVAVGVNLITLLIALAPSSKIDELYYHMLAPARLLGDGGLVFYRYPWEAAILPQMHYQLGLVGTHAVGVADGGNVASWCLAVLTQMFVGRVVSTNPRVPAGLPTVFGVATGVGVLAMVTNVTAGPHAFGALAVTLLVAGSCPAPAARLGLTVTGEQRVGLVSWLAVAAAASKLTLIPLAGVCVLVCTAHEWAVLRPRPVTLWRWASHAALPWIAIYAPLVGYTAVASGAPFGPAFADVFGGGAYVPGEAASIHQRTLTHNRVGLAEFAKNAVISYSPLVWAGVMACAAGRGLPGAIRTFGVGLTALQFGIIFTLVQNDVRFVGGYQFGLLAAVPTLAPANWWGRVRGRWWPPTLVGLGVLPWVGGMAYYSVTTPFVQTSLGLVSRDDFVARYTALRDDFVALDQLLPADAVLLVAGVRVNSASAPRPVLLDPRDPTLARSPYFLVVGNTVPPIKPYHVGEIVYENAAALTTAFRKPGAAPVVGRVRVFRLDGGRP